MAFLKAFGRYLPERVLGNAELAQRLGITAEWIVGASGIAERRIAADDESVVDIGVAAARDCLMRASLDAAEIGMLVVSSGFVRATLPWPGGERRTAPGLRRDSRLGSAAGQRRRHCSASSLANAMAVQYGNVMVVAAEKMSALVIA